MVTIRSRATMQSNAIKIYKRKIRITYIIVQNKGQSRLHYKGFIPSMIFFIIIMSFCQKHLNHHCIHAHQCNNHKHQRRPPKQPQQKITQQYKNRKNTQSSCTFLGTQIPKTSKQNVQAEDNELSIMGFRRTIALLEEKSRSLESQNKNLLIQIEYYRQQFTQIVGNNATDTKNLIKKGLKQTTELELKLKSLISENAQLKQQNQGFRRFLHDDKINRQSNKHINHDLQEKYASIYQNFKVTAKERDELLNKLLQNEKEQSRWQEKYQLLKKQFEFESNTMMKSIKILEQDLNSTKKELGEIKRTANRQKELEEIEKTSGAQKQALYQTKIKEYEQQISELRQTVKQLTQKCEEMEEDLIHSKALVEKSLLNNNELQSLTKQMKERDLQIKTVVKERSNCYSNKQNLSNDDENQKLREQIVKLNLKIQEMEKRQLISLEEVVMNMGASEAFKKLVEEKNKQIKRLIRQKGEIYSKIVISQSG